MVLEKVRKKLVLAGYTHVNFTVSEWRRTCFISFKGSGFFLQKIWGESFGVFFRVFAQVGLLSTGLAVLIWNMHTHSLYGSIKLNGLNLKDMYCVGHFHKWSKPNTDFGKCAIFNALKRLAFLDLDVLVKSFWEKFVSKRSVQWLNANWRKNNKR